MTAAEDPQGTLLMMVVVAAVAAAAALVLPPPAAKAIYHGGGQRHLSKPLEYWSLSFRENKDLASNGRQLIQSEDDRNSSHCAN